MNPTSNTLAFSATLHCLSGCALGEILGLIVGTALGWHGATTILLAVLLAFLFGYSFTAFPLLRSGLAVRSALGIALAADTLSITVMEIVDNLVIVIVPGAMAASLADWLFWGSLTASLVAAFAAAFPINKWLLAHGKGHALVHRHHTRH